MADGVLVTAIFLLQLWKRGSWQTYLLQHRFSVSRPWARVSVQTVIREVTLQTSLLYFNIYATPIQDFSRLPFCLVLHGRLSINWQSSLSARNRLLYRNPLRRCLPTSKSDHTRREKTLVNAIKQPSAKWTAPTRVTRSLACRPLPSRPIDHRKRRRQYTASDKPASAAHGACLAAKLPEPGQGQLKQLANLEDAISTEFIHPWPKMNPPSGNLSIKDVRVWTGHTVAVR